MRDMAPKKPSRPVELRSTIRVAAMSPDIMKQPGTGEASSLDDSPTGPELVIRGIQGTPEEIERQWFEKVYTGRGDSQKQLTLRAVLMGGFLGMLMSLSNLYTTLKLGHFSLPFMRSSAGTRSPASEEPWGWLNLPDALVLPGLSAR